MLLSCICSQEVRHEHNEHRLFPMIPSRANVQLRTLCAKSVRQDWVQDSLPVAGCNPCSMLCKWSRPSERRVGEVCTAQLQTEQVLPSTKYKTWRSHVQQDGQLALHHACGTAAWVLHGTHQHEAAEEAQELSLGQQAAKRHRNPQLGGTPGHPALLNRLVWAVNLPQVLQSVRGSNLPVLPISCSHAAERICDILGQIPPGPLVVEEVEHAVGNEHVGRVPAVNCMGDHGQPDEKERKGLHQCI